MKKRSLLLPLLAAGVVLQPPKCSCPACAPLLSTRQPTEAAVRALKFYKQAISPLLPPGCRFIPTCSEYGQQCFEQFTVPQAVVLLAWRLLRCNPLHWPGTGFGIDAPVWPPPPYWAGNGQLRTLVDDEISRQRANGELDGPPLPYDPLGLASSVEDASPSADARRADGGDEPAAK